MADFNPDAARAAMAGIHGVSTAVLKAQGKVLDKAWPGASSVIDTGTEALGNVWRGLGIMPQAPGTAPVVAPAAVTPVAPPVSAPAGAPAAQPPAAAPADSSAGLLEALPEKTRRYLASRGVLSLPPLPPEDALRAAPAVVAGVRVPATTSTRPAAVNGKRLGL